jgi:hypothetical protein
MYPVIKETQDPAGVQLVINRLDNQAKNSITSRHGLGQLIII